MCRRDRDHWRLIGYWENCSSAGWDFQTDSEPSRSPAKPCNEQTQGRSSLIKTLVAKAMRALQKDSFIFRAGGRKHCQKKVVEQILFIAGPRVSRAGNVCAFQGGEKEKHTPGRNDSPCATRIPAEDEMTAWVKRPQRCVHFRQGEDTSMQHSGSTAQEEGSQIYSTRKSSSQLAHPERRLQRNTKARINATPD